MKIKFGYQKLVLGNFMQKETGDMQKIMGGYVENAATKEPEDYVATGKQYSIKFFVEKVLKKLKIKYKWIGKELRKSYK